MAQQHQFDRSSRRGAGQPLSPPLPAKRQHHRHAAAVITPLLWFLVLSSSFLSTSRTWQQRDSGGNSGESYHRPRYNGSKDHQISVVEPVTAGTTLSTMTLPAIAESDARVATSSADRSNEPNKTAVTSTSEDDRDTAATPVGMASAVIPVNASHLIYHSKRLSPVVLPQYRLIFFDVPKVASTAFMILFQKMVYGSPSSPFASSNPSLCFNSKIRRTLAKRLLSAYLDKGSVLSGLEMGFKIYLLPSAVFSMDTSIPPLSNFFPDNGQYSVPLV